VKNNKKILANALIEICNHKPLDNVTVTEITKKAGLTRQVFYHHFVDKYELAKWIHMMDYVGEIEEKSSYDEELIYWKDVSFEWLSVLEKHKVFYQNLYHSTADKEFQRLIRMHIFDSYKYTLEYSLKEKLNEEMIFSLQIYCTGLTERIHDWIRDGMNIPVSQFCDWMFVAMPSTIRKVMSEYKVSKKILIKQTKFVAQLCEADRKSYM